MSETTVMILLIWLAAVMGAVWLGQAVWQWATDRRELPRVEQPQPQSTPPSWVLIDLARARQARARHRARGIR